MCWSVGGGFRDVFFIIVGNEVYIFDVKVVGDMRFWDFYGWGRSGEDEDEGEVGSGEEEDGDFEVLVSIFVWFFF